MRPFLVAALYIAFVLAVAAVALSAQSDASRALPTSTAPRIAALMSNEPGVSLQYPTPDPSNVGAEAPIDQRPVRSAAPTPLVVSSVGSDEPSASPVVSARPTSLPRHARFLRGQATWWDSWGSGFYVAVNPSDGIPVGSVIEVCDAQAQHCLSAPVTTTCACKGPDSGRIVDLSRDLFARFTDPSAGVMTVVLEVVE